MSSPPPSPQAETRLEELLHDADFPPPAGFAAQAKVADPAVYEQAAADSPAWWAGQARQRLDWDARSPKSSTTAIRRSTGGSPTARSTCRTTASTGMSKPATATGWPSTGTARKVSSAS